MNALFVTPYPPKPDGIGEHTRGLVEALRTSGRVDVDVLTLRRPAPSEPTPGVHRLLSADPRCARAAFDLVRRLRPDVMHYQFAIPGFGLAGLAAFGVGRRARAVTGAHLVVTLHEVRREIDLLGPAGRCVYRRLVGLADAVVVHTEDARALVLRECGADPASVWTMPLGAPEPAAGTLDAATVAAVRERYGVGARPLILCFGFIHPDKGIEHLIAATARLRDRDPVRAEQIDVVVAGTVRPRGGMFRYFEAQDREYERILRGLVTRHGLERQVRFLGFVPTPDVPALFASARAVVVPYTKVTQSSVLSMATVAGVPVVASDLPGLREMLGSGGLLVPPGDPRALADAVARVLADDGLALELRERQRRRGQQVRFARVAAELEARYRSIVSNRKELARVG